MSAVFKKLLPTLNRVLVRKIEQESKTATGILLSSSPDNNPIGEIMQIGPGNVSDQGKLIPLSLKIGQTVVLPEYGGQKVNLKDGEFFLYRDSDIQGILEN